MQHLNSTPVIDPTVFIKRPTHPIEAKFAPQSARNTRNRQTGKRRDRENARNLRKISNIRPSMSAGS